MPVVTVLQCGDISMNASAKRIVVILGMHRSGTSAVTCALNILGVDIGQRLNPPVEGINAKGFFEDIDIYSLNVEMLQALGSDWDCLAKIERRDIDFLQKNGYFLRAAALLRSKTVGVGIFGFKDPRVARLLPFWHQVFSYCRFNASYVLVVRNPVSIVQSLAKRDGFIAEKSYMLWLGHVLASLVNSEEHKRALIDYDRFVHDPQKDLMVIADRLDLPFDAQAFNRYQREFLDEGLRHSLYEASDLALDQACPPLVQELYLELLNVSRDNKQLDNTAFRRRTARWVDEFNRFNLNLRWIDNLNQSINAHNAEITELIISALKQDENCFQGSFNSQWYLKKYPDIADAGIDPYLHYISVGTREGRLPSDDIAAFVRDGLSGRLKELNGQIHNAKGAVQAQLLELAECEKTHSQQLRLTEQAHGREMEEQNSRHAEREQALVVQLTQSRGQIEGYLIELAEREKTHSQQLWLAEQAHEREKEEENRRHAEREQALVVQLAIARQQIEGYLIELTEREKTHSQQLRLSEQAHEQHREEQSRQHAERELQLDQARRQIEGYLVELAEREKTSQQLRLSEQAVQRQQEEQDRQYAEREQAVNTQLRAIQDEYHNLTIRSAAAETGNTQEITQLNLELSAMRATYTWRWTAPLRRLANLLGKNISDRPTKHTSIGRYESANRETISSVVNQSLIPWVPLNTSQIREKLAVAQNHNSVAAATLDELLSHDNERFIHGVYHTLLQRAPDPEGLRYYHRRLLAGVSKIQILAEISDSPEGIENAVEIPGLREIIKLHKLSRLPLIGRLLVGPFFLQPSSSVSSLDSNTLKFKALLAYDDLQFIDSVYLMILKRRPDPEGLDFYLDRLRNGVSKIQILGEIIESPEASSKATAVLGWRAVVKMHKLSRIPLIGRLMTTPAIAANKGRSEKTNGVKDLDVQDVESDIANCKQVEMLPRNAGDTENNKSDDIRHSLEVMTDESPLISVIMPVYKTPIELLRCAVTSVIEQSYSKWQLCICDDGSSDQELRQLLLGYSQLDDRINVTFLNQNAGISTASNKAIDLATGEFIAFLDHDDSLTLDALAEVAHFISNNSDVDVIYTDQDKINERGTVTDAFHKPDWSPDYFRRVMYVGHLLVVRACLVKEVGGFKDQYNRVQDYEFLLRISETTSKIGHIPKVLYHWRAIEGSIAATSNAKGEIESLQCAAVRSHLERIGLSREVLAHPIYAHRTTIKPFKSSEEARVSIIIPSKNRPEHIGRCLQSIFGRTTYQNLEVIVVDNGTTDNEALRILSSYPIKVVPYNEQFNYSKANNLGADCSTGDVLILLNNDTEVITTNWIEVLLSNLDQDDVGVVGPMLLYPDLTVQHAGIVLGPRGTADHVMRGFPWKTDGYAGSLSCVREVSGVTGACLMTRKSTYAEIGGLVEHYGTHYQDVDYCLRVRAQGKRILHVPDAQLIHYEGATRGSDYDLLDRLLLQDSWARELSGGDPYFNPAFSLERLDYSLAIEKIGSRNEEDKLSTEAGQFQEA